MWRGAAARGRTGGRRCSTAQPPCVIDLRRLTQPQDVHADNLTATVGAGIPLADLDALLAAEGLCWPVERLDGGIINGRWDGGYRGGGTFAARYRADGAVGAGRRGG